MCRVLGVQRSGFYAWLKQPISKLARENIRLTGLIKQAWLESGCVYGYRKTHEGWLYLAVVIDLYSRRVVGWSMQSRMHMDLVLSALLTAVWRRKPKHRIIVHSDQGSQFTGHEWNTFLGKHHLEMSMSRKGNCYDNAVAESFFQLLKRERIRRKTYATRKDARDDVFDYIEFFYNPKRKHGNNKMLSPVDFEKQQLGK